MGLVHVAQPLAYGLNLRNFVDLMRPHISRRPRFLHPNARPWVVLWQTRSTHTTGIAAAKPDWAPGQPPRGADPPPVAERSVRSKLFPEPSPFDPVDITRLALPELPLIHE